MLKNLRCFIIFFFILSWAEGEYNLKLKAELKEQGSHPRFVIKNNEETSIIAIFSKDDDKSKFKEWNGSQIKLEHTCNSFGENAVVTQFKTREGELKKYILVNYKDNKFELIVFDEELNCHITFFDKQSISYKPSVTPLSSGKILLGWVWGNKITFTKIMLNEGDNTLTEESFPGTWDTDNLFITCIEMSENYSNIIVCLYVEKFCKETYMVMNSDGTILKKGEFQEGEYKGPTQGCSFDKIFKLEEPFIGFCFIQDHVNFVCHIGELVKKDLSNQDKMIRMREKAELSNLCWNQIVHTDISTFSNNIFVISCIHKNENNPLFIFFHFSVEGGLKYKKIMIPKEKARYPSSSLKNFETFYAAFYIEDKRESYFYIFYIQECQDYRSFPQGIIFIPINKHFIINDIEKTIIFNRDETLLPKLYFESEPEKGILKVNGESLVPKKLYELNSELDFASSEPGIIHVFYAGYIEGFNRGRVCKIIFVVYSCGEGCLQCEDDSLSCTECDTSNGFIISPIDSTKCVKKCQTYWYNDNGKYTCTKNKSCDVPGLSYLETKEGQCVNSCSDQNCIKCKESTLEYQKNCLSNCPEGTTPVNSKCESSCNASISNTNNNNISSLLTDSLDSYIDKSHSNDDSILNIKGENFFIQIFRNSACEKEESLKHEVSFINITECKSILKEKTGRTDIMFVKADISKDETKSKRVVLEAFDNDKNKIDISACENVTSEMPLTDDAVMKLLLLEQNKIDALNPISTFFKDFCFPYYDKNRKDVVPIDRFQYIYGFDECQDGCSFEKVDLEKKTFECSCKVGKIDLSRIVFNQKSDSLIKIDNLIVLKCYNLVFKWKYIKINIGEWLMLVLFICQIPSLIFFCSTRMNSLFSYLLKISGKKKKKYFHSPPLKKTRENNDSEEITSETKRDLTSKKSKKSVNKRQNLSIIVKSSKTKLPLFDLSSESRERNENTERGKVIEERSEKINDFTDFELNEMNFEKASLFDKRPFMPLLWSIMKLKVFVIRPFVNVTLLDPLWIKAIFFFLNISIYLVLNVLFFSISSISKRFKKERVTVGFYFENEFLKVILSCFVGSFLCFLISLLTDNQRRYKLKFETEKEMDKFLSNAKPMINSLLARMISFCIINALLMCFSWYYISAFCAVFLKSQEILLINFGITIVLALILQVIYSFLLALLRILGIKYQKKCLFYPTKILI